jgi:hypothetical protein
MDCRTPGILGWLKRKKWAADGTLDDAKVSSLCWPGGPCGFVRGLCTLSKPTRRGPRPRVGLGDSEAGASSRRADWNRPGAAWALGHRSPCRHRGRAYYVVWTSAECHQTRLACQWPGAASGCQCQRPEPRPLRQPGLSPRQRVRVGGQRIAAARNEEEPAQPAGP